MGEGLEVFFYFREMGISGTGSKGVWNVNGNIGTVIGGFFCDEGRGGACQNRSVDQFCEQWTHSQSGGE
jgi:hypothetical protein